MLPFAAGVLNHKSFYFSTTDIFSHVTEPFTFKNTRNTKAVKELQIIIIIINNNNKAQQIRFTPKFAFLLRWLKSVATFC